MALTLHELPFSNKTLDFSDPNRTNYLIKSGITKQVKFNVKQSVASNNYTQVIGLSLRAFEESYSLSYTGLSDIEKAYVEGVFISGNSNHVLVWKPPTEATNMKFRLPASWQVTRYPDRTQTTGYSSDLSFTLVSYYG
jgi:phage-related protein